MKDFLDNRSEQEAQGSVRGVAARTVFSQLVQKTRRLRIQSAGMKGASSMMTDIALGRSERGVEM